MRKIYKSLDNSETREWKNGLKFNIQKTKIMVSGPISSWQVDTETVLDFIYFVGGGLLQSLQMVTVAMKLKDAYCLAEKLWPTYTEY